MSWLTGQIEFILEFTYMGGGGGHVVGSPRWKMTYLTHYVGINHVFSIGGL